MQTFEENYINNDNPIENYLDMSEKFKQTWISYCNIDKFYTMNHK